jgi:hypothetical protein
MRHVVPTERRMGASLPHRSCRASAGSYSGRVRVSVDAGHFAFGRERQHRQR